LSGPIGSVTVGKAPLTVICQNVQVPCGTINLNSPTNYLAYTFSGFVNNEGSGYVAGTPNYVTAPQYYATNQPGTTSNWSVTGLSASNYTLTCNPGILTVGQAPTSWSKGGETVTLLNQPTATTQNSPATTTVQFNIGYSGMPSNATKLTLGNGSLTVTPSGLGGNNVQPTVALPPDSSGNTLMTVVLSGNAPGAYNIMSQWQVYTPSDTPLSAPTTVMIPFTVMGGQAAPTSIAGIGSLTYGQSETLTVSGGSAQGASQLQVSSDGGNTWSGQGLASLSSTQWKFTPTQVGSYTFRAMWSASGYYNASPWWTSSSQTVVGKAMLVATGIPFSISAGQPFPAALYAKSILVSGFVNGDSEATVGAPSATTSYSPSNPAGKYAITPTGGGMNLNNYSFQGVGSTLTVLPADAQTGRNQKPSVGGPVELASGAESFSRNLFSFAGARNWSFAIAYNSSLGGSQPAPGPLGLGWTHPFETSVSASAGYVVVHWDATHFNNFVATDSTNTKFVSSDQASFYDVVTPAAGGGWILTHRDQSSLVFDSSGKLIEDHDAHGRKLVCGYNSANQLVSVTEPISATSLTFAYNQAGELATATDAAGATVTFTYNGSTALLGKVVNQNGYSVVFGYDSSDQLLTLTDNAGNVLTTDVYDSAGRVISQADGVSGHKAMTLSYQQTDPSQNMVTTVVDKTGNQWIYTSDVDGNLLSVVDPLGRTTSATYDSAGDVTSRTDGLGNTWTYTYDSSGNLLTSEDPAGNSTAFTYDSSNNLLQSTDPLNRVASFTYDSNNDVLGATDAVHGKTTYTYDANSLLLTKTLPAGGVYSFTYLSGRVSKATDPDNVSMTYSYDADGRTASATDAQGKLSSWTHDLNGNTLTATDRSNQTTTMGYDYRNRLTSTKDPLGAITSFSYDNNNNRLTVTDPLDNTTTLAYDGNDRLLSTTDPLGHVTSIAYDASRQVVSKTNGAGESTTLAYDGAGNLTSSTDPLGHATSYSVNSRGFVTAVTDPLNRIEAFIYDAAGQKTSSTDPLSQTTSYTFDAVGRVTGVKDPGGIATGQSFDGDGNRTGLSDGSSNAAAFVFDPADRLTKQSTAAGHTTAYSYDSRGQLSTTTTPLGNQQTYTYDANGRRSGFSDPVGSIVYTRDALGRILTETENGKTLTRTYDLDGRMTSITDGSGNAIGYAFDSAGNVTSLTYPNGQAVVYGYDAANRMVSVTDWAGRKTSYGYDGAGRLSTTTRPDGSIQTRNYDLAGQLTGIVDSAPGGTVLYSDAIGYDGDGRITTENILPSVPVAPISLRPQTFDADNRLLNSNGRSTSFDSDGNLLSLPGMVPAAFAYDARDRLTNAGGLSYTYDCEGHRVGVTDSTGLTQFVVNPLSSLSTVLTRVASNGTATNYVYGLGLIYEDTQRVARIYHFDRRGNLASLTDVSGNVTGRCSVGIYGQVLWSSGLDGVIFVTDGLHGVVSDSNGLTYNRARYYSPSMGRFLNQDPTLGDLRRPGSLNRFAFAEGVPNLYVDPTGYMIGDPMPASSGGGGFWARLFSALGPIPTPGANIGGDFVALNDPDFQAQTSSNTPQVQTDQIVHLKAPAGYIQLGDEFVSISSLNLTVEKEMVVPFGPSITNSIETLLGISAAGTEIEAPLRQQLEQQQMSGPSLRMTPDQQALKELVDEVTLSGRRSLTGDQANTILDWADEVGYRGVRASPEDLATPSNWTQNPVPHIHFPGLDFTHIPVEPGVVPR
jgi:RHS repeat-associated protein